MLQFILDTHAYDPWPAVLILAIGAFAAALVIRYARRRGRSVPGAIFGIGALSALLAFFWPWLVLAYACIVRQDCL